MATAPARIRVPEGALVHHEVELAVVIAKSTANVATEKDAWDCVEGYRCAIDLTARNWQNDAKKQGLPWTKAKSCDTFLPLGPFVHVPQVEGREVHDGRFLGDRPAV